MLGARSSTILIVALAGLAGAAKTTAAPPSFDSLAKDYEGRVKPLIGQYCLNCHSTKKHKGDFDLEAYATVADFRRDPEVWQKIADAIDSREMPPKGSAQPDVAQRAELRRWVGGALDAEAASSPGDPGRVVTRRLTNVEYNNTVRDLTAIDLEPAREFPADGAAGEGFTNVSDALVMSPAMLDKYLAAAKGIAAHAVLLPDGIRFSEKTTRPDWTEEILAQIKQVYRRYTNPGGATQVKLQGLVWDTKGGGLIPLEPYLAATIAYRDSGPAKKSLETLATENHLSAKYLRTLWQMLDGPRPSPLLNRVRDLWRSARLEDVPTLAAEIRQWQGALTRFRSVGHFKPWQETANPLEESQVFRIKLVPAPGVSEVVLRLVTGDAGDGSTGNLVQWKEPRLESPGRPLLLLRDLRGAVGLLEAKREIVKRDAARYLAVADEVRTGHAVGDPPTLAKDRGLDPELLAAWFDVLGIAGSGRAAIVDSLFTNRMERGGGYEFVKSWGSPETPSVVANSSGREVRIPGIMKPHSVAMHPSPTRKVVVGWRSPMTGMVHLEARVVHAHPECGNGLAWALELRRDAERRRLRAGEIERGQAATIEPVNKLSVHSGDLVSLLISPRGDHACDLTEVDLTISENEGGHRVWNLAADVSGDILAGNPHTDSLGHRDVWHFYHEAVNGESSPELVSIPAGSMLDRWRDEARAEERTRLGVQLQTLLIKGPGPGTTKPDALLYAHLTSLGGPLLGRIDAGSLTRRAAAKGANQEAAEQTSRMFGLPPEMFGKHPQGREADRASLLVHAPSVIEVRLPAELVSGREFVASASMDSHDGAEGSAQARVLVDQLTQGNSILPDLPILVRNGSAARQRIEASFDDFRRLFPAALCYSQIVPVDEVVTLSLYHREDENLSRLMLDEPEQRSLERLWDELWYVSQEALKVEVGYVQFMEYTTQDSDPNLFKPLRKPITERAAALRKRLIDTEPKHLDAVLEFAERAYRRPLSVREESELKNLYSRLRKQDLDHDAAIRLTLARVLIAPAYLYRTEHSAEGAEPRPVTDWELASRLSFFLWASMPDLELRRLAAEGKLHVPEVLAGQVRRMLADSRARALATEFACQWLEIRGFDRHNEKSEQAFPEFAALRGAMYEEAVRFFIDLFQRNGSLLEVIDSDHTFLNEPLARHYAISGVTGPLWRRVDGIKAQARGGVLGMAALLAKQSGASRTSPILRGNWLLETLLGEKLPKPPKNVPQLPESELDTGGLTMRQITEKHRSVESCARCHNRIDPFGFALEAYDAIGRRRKTDLGGRPINTQVRLQDGTTFADIDGLRSYLLSQRREEFVRHFCRKLLGYSLGRSVQLSDKSLLDEMERQLNGKDQGLLTAMITVVQSPQFRLRRGLASPLDQQPSQRISAGDRP